MQTKRPARRTLWHLVSALPSAAATRSVAARPFGATQATKTAIKSVLYWCASTVFGWRQRETELICARVVQILGEQTMFVPRVAVAARRP